MTKPNTIKYLEWKIKKFIDSKAPDHVIHRWVEFYFDMLKAEQTNSTT